MDTYSTHVQNLNFESPLLLDLHLVEYKQYFHLNLKRYTPVFKGRFLMSRQYINNILTFSSFPCCEDSLHAQTEVVSLGVAKLSSIVLITQSLMIPVIKTSFIYDCVSRIPWGTSVFLAGPRSTSPSSSPGFFDTCLFSSYPFSYFYSLHSSHNTSWLKSHVLISTFVFPSLTLIGIMTQLFYACNIDI